MVARYRKVCADCSTNNQLTSNSHRQYYEALDIATASITSRFNQPGYIVYKNLESLLVSAANDQAYDPFFDILQG